MSAWLSLLSCFLHMQNQLKDTIIQNFSPAGNYMFKVNNRNTRARCFPGVFQGSDVFIVNFEHISHIVLVFSLLTLNM